MTTAFLAQAKKLVGTNFYFETSTVTGTENILMAACLAEGTTIIENAAREPEIIDLANCLNSMGADIERAGASKIIVRGKRGLKGCHYTIMPDRIEAGTYAVAAVATQGDFVKIWWGIVSLGVLITAFWNLSLEI